MTRYFVPGAGVGAGGTYIIAVNALAWTQVFDNNTLGGPDDAVIAFARPVFASRLNLGTQTRRLIHAIDGVTWTIVDADVVGLADDIDGFSYGHPKFALSTDGLTLRVMCGGGPGNVSRVRDTGDLVNFATHLAADFGAISGHNEMVLTDALALFAHIGANNASAFFKDTGAWTAQAGVPTGVGVTPECMGKGFGTIFSGKTDGSLHRYNPANNTWVSVVAAGGFGVGNGVRRLAWMPSLQTLFIATDSATAAQRIFALTDLSGVPAPASIAAIDGSIGVGNRVADLIVVPSSPPQLYIICDGAAAPMLRSADGVTVAANLGVIPNVGGWTNLQLRVVYNPFDTRFYLGGQTGGGTARIYRSAVVS